MGGGEGREEEKERKRLRGGRVGKETQERDRYTGEREEKGKTNHHNNFSAWTHTGLKML